MKKTRVNPSSLVTIPHSWLSTVFSSTTYTRKTLILRFRSTDVTAFSEEAGKFRIPPSPAFYNVSVSLFPAYEKVWLFKRQSGACECRYVYVALLLFYVNYCLSVCLLLSVPPLPPSAFLMGRSNSTLITFSLQYIFSPTINELYSVRYCMPTSTDLTKYFGISVR